MSVDPRRAGSNPDFSPPLPLPVPDENRHHQVSTSTPEPAKKVSIDVGPQQPHSNPRHLKSVDTGSGIFVNSASPGNVAASGSILKRRPQSERILEPHVVHIRKTETGKTEEETPTTIVFGQLIDSFLDWHWLIHNLNLPILVIQSYFRYSLKGSLSLFGLSMINRGRFFKKL